nr:MAG TPA: hypothetical protein [Bacteriophage sp.]
MCKQDLLNTGLSTSSLSGQPIFMNRISLLLSWLNNSLHITLININ